MLVGLPLVPTLVAVGNRESSQLPLHNRSFLMAKLTCLCNSQRLTDSFIGIRDTAISAPPGGSLALIAAVCFIAACSANASGDLKSVCPVSTSSAWKVLADQLLSSNGYPRQPNLNTVRAAFLLALPSVAGGRIHPGPGPVCVLLRAAQSLGLHRDPSSVNLSPREMDSHRVLCWVIHGLDVSYSVAHALPPLIHAAATDVQMIEHNAMSDRKLIGTLIRVNSLISTIFQTVYGIHQPTGKDIQELDEKANTICTDDYSTQTPPEMNTAEKFITMSQECVATKCSSSYINPIYDQLNGRKLPDKKH
ncbi:hypothetical protein BDV38DRAFT_280073 [Aspergillus pseudotamarii]|uniref:Xylanolytic transcriptional activator regulatory domain-containing protein n=1 Tax=Aspergillus pseudotamarii TaxID=132259 RepID=A0A5N6T2P1_ASPPS|nr:uncharacterized protein BDV38DRAFT_280073 [Aspergillus pseudotamarii]KAE8140575.1 hypothetical protein BDV38DRAFT_280073 [Aspergillus pseudotamarii]